MTSKPEEIGAGIRKMEKEIDYINEQIIDVCFHMRGGITWTEAWQLSFKDRERLVKNLNVKIRKMSGDTREFM